MRRANLRIPGKMRKAARCSNPSENPAMGLMRLCVYLIVLGIIAWPGRLDSKDAERESGGEIAYAAFRVPGELLRTYRQRGTEGLLFGSLKKEGKVKKTLPRAAEANRKLTGASDLLDLAPALEDIGVVLEGQSMAGFSPGHAMIFVRGSESDVALLKTFFEREDKGWDGRTHVWPAKQNTVTITTVPAIKNGAPPIPQSWSELFKAFPDLQILGRYGFRRLGDKVVFVSGDTLREDGVQVDDGKGGYFAYKLEMLLTGDWVRRPNFGGNPIEAMFKFDGSFAREGGALVSTLSRDITCLIHPGGANVIELGKHPLDGKKSLLLVIETGRAQPSGAKIPPDNLGGKWFKKNPIFAEAKKGDAEMQMAVITIPRNPAGSYLADFVDDRAVDEHVHWGLLEWMMFADLKDEAKWLQVAKENATEIESYKRGVPGAMEMETPRIHHPPKVIQDLFGGDVFDVSKSLRKKWQKVELGDDSLAILSIQRRSLFLYATGADIKAIRKLIAQEWGRSYGDRWHVTVQLPGRRFSSILRPESYKEYRFIESERKAGREIDHFWDPENAMEADSSFGVDLMRYDNELNLACEIEDFQTKEFKPLKITKDKSEYRFPLFPEGQAIVTLAELPAAVPDQSYRYLDLSTVKRWKDFIDQRKDSSE